MRMGRTEQMDRRTDQNGWRYRTERTDGQNGVDIRIDKTEKSGREGCGKNTADRPTEQSRLTRGTEGSRRLNSETASRDRQTDRQTETKRHLERRTGREM